MSLYPRCTSPHNFFSNGPHIRHYLAVPPGSHLLSSVILDSPILAGDRGVSDELGGLPGAAGASGSGGASQFEFGVDPSLDPELALVCPDVLPPGRQSALINCTCATGSAGVYGRGGSAPSSC